MLSASVPACRDSGPEPVIVEGIWQLRTVDGRSLPAASAALQGSMTGGVLRLVQGSTWSEYCVDRGAGEPVPLHRGGGFEELGDGRALILYYTSTGAGTIPSDTLTVAGDGATLHLRQGAAAADVLGFQRVAGAETDESETPGACSPSP